MERLELSTSSSRTTRATWLRYIPKQCKPVRVLHICGAKIINYTGSTSGTINNFPYCFLGIYGYNLDISIPSDIFVYG